MNETHIHGHHALSFFLKAFAVHPDAALKQINRWNIGTLSFIFSSRCCLSK